MFWKSRRFTSLALRLSVWYAGSAFLLLAAGTGFLYWKLVQSFNAEDNQYLAEKANTLTKLLREGDFRMLQWEVEGESSVRPGVKILSRVFSHEGHILLESTGMSEQLPVSLFPAADGIESRTIHARPLPKQVFSLLSAQTPDYRLQIGLEVTFEKNLLAEYREGLWAVLSIGLFLSAMTGYRIARRGIRPVEEIAATVRRIRARTLNQRVETAGLPSELSVLASTFNETLDGLEDAFARMSQFSSDIAHELRTPINNIRGEVEVALGKPRSMEEYREVLESSLEECLRLSRTIDSLLFLARAEHPETHIRREPVDVGDELTAIGEFYEASASDAGVSFQHGAAAELTVPMDRTLFQRAVGNLVENALAHTSPGGHIRIEAVRENGTLRVSVTDDGCGIPAAHLPRVFDRFYRVDAARSHNRCGSGLGLAIVKSIVTLHGGDVRIQSTPSQGTCVTLRIPAGGDMTEL